MRQRQRALAGQEDNNTGARIAMVAAIGGALVAVVGVVGYAVSRRRQQQEAIMPNQGPGIGPPGSFGRLGQVGSVRDVQRVGGARLTHHYDRAMPIKKRIALLQDLTFKSVKNPQMRELALAITGDGTREVIVGKRTYAVRGAGCPARDGLCEARAIYDWVHNNIRYTGDVAPIKLGAKGPLEGIDLFQAAYRTVEYGGGDCDDHGVLNAALLAHNGIQPKFRVTAPGRFAEWAHIYALAGLPKNDPSKYVALDTTIPGYFFGREAPNGRVADFDA